MWLGREFQQCRHVPLSEEEQPPAADAIAANTCNGKHAASVYIQQATGTIAKKDMILTL
jgi:hypothetical protein